MTPAASPLWPKGKPIRALNALTMTNEQATKYECQNCGKAFAEDELITPLPDLEQRVGPGEPMPAGPECGAVCHEKKRRVTLAAVRLTQTQARDVESIADSWGEVFQLFYSYEFLRKKGLVRKATPEEASRYFAGLRRDLEQKSAALVEAAQAGAYTQAKSLANTCRYLGGQLAEEADVREELCALSAAGVEAVRKIKAKRAAAE
jgi:hypothetical protein